MVRFFAGWDFVSDDALSRMPAEIGYTKGVPMGGDLRDAPEEVQGGQEVLDAPFAADAAAVLAQMPGGQGVQVIAQLLGGQRRHSALARLAAFLFQLRGAGRHRSVLPDVL